MQGTSLSTWTSSLDTEATRKAVIQAGTAIFQYLYHGPNLTLGEIRYKMFSRKAVAGVIKPETLPPTVGSAVQHSLRAYLQTWTGFFYRACLLTLATMDGH